MSCQDCNCGRKEQEEAEAISGNSMVLNYNGRVIKNGQISYGTIESYAPVTFQTSPDSLYPEVVASSNDSEASEIISDLLSVIEVPDEVQYRTAVFHTTEQRLRQQADQIVKLKQIVNRAREYLKK